MLLSIVLIFVFIFLNGIFAASEVALISANTQRIEQDALNGKKKATSLLKFMHEPALFLSSIQIGITVIGFLNGIIAAEAFTDTIIGWFSNGVTSLIRVLIQVGITLVLSYFQVVLGELVPKRIGMKYPEKIAYSTIGLLRFISFVLRPFVWLFTSSANLIGKIFGINPSKDDDKLSEEDIRLMVAASGKKGRIEQNESDMIDNIFEFNDTTVDEIMTHRTEVSAIRSDATIDDILAYVSEEKYTRFPVYEDSIDRIIGTVHAKDLLKYTNELMRKQFNLKSILREPYFIPDSKKISELFKEMQLSKTHIAIVIDEYGGTAGIVTIEDLIEEIVGNIFDEYDEVETDIEELNQNEYIIDGLTDLEDVEERLNIDLPIEEYDTLSGFIIGQLGRFPEENEKIIINYNAFHFEVLEIEDKVITSVKVTKFTEEEIEALKETLEADPDDDI